MTAASSFRGGRIAVRLIYVVGTAPDQFHVLEDNCRTPSGVSLPQHLVADAPQPVSRKPDQLLDLLGQAPPDTGKRGARHPTARAANIRSGPIWWVELIEGRDLFAEESMSLMRTTGGPQRVDMLYRRIDDAYLDPLCFRPGSMPGVPWLMPRGGAGTAMDVTVAVQQSAQ